VGDADWGGLRFENPRQVTIGGWIVSYIIEYRGGGPSSGYVSTGFFGGLTVGRVVLIPLNKKVRKGRDG
jgi:fucose permease